MSLPSIATLEAKQGELLGLVLALGGRLEPSLLFPHLNNLHEKYQTLKSDDGKAKVAALISAWQPLLVPQSTDELPHQAIEISEKIIVLAKGGPSFINLCQPHHLLRLVVNGPGMLFSSLKLVSNLGSEEGFDIQRLKKFAEGLEVQLLCAYEGKQIITATVESDRTGAYVSLPCGPMSMYQSEILIKSAQHATLAELLQATLFELLTAEARAQAIVGLIAMGETVHHGGMEMVWLEPPPSPHHHQGEHHGHP